MVSPVPVPLAAAAPSGLGGPADDDAYLTLPPDLVVGEAVALDLRPASFASRALALLLDVVVQFGVFLTLSFLLGVTLGLLDPAAGTAAGLVMVVAVLVGLPVTVETLTRGRSLGKLATGLRVVRDDGGPIRFRHALVRQLVGVFEFWLAFGSPALICSLLDSRGRRLGDLLAGTFVIRERAARVTFPLPGVVPQLAAWARGADIGRIPDELALTARQFLRRAPSMHPAARHDLGARLAGALARYVAPPPPPGVGPEPYLAAVLAERRDRDLARLRADRTARDERDRRREAAGLLSPGGAALVGQAPSGR